ncbi:MAG: DMT family protein [Planctomycetota bacterium]|nr:DMT family protein [Planctomycetota bacterium]
MTTVILLIFSNLFMTIAWYGHLKFPMAKIVPVILVSWLIALPEYIFQVPANRIGHASGITGPQLKIIQEVISISAFVAFNAWILKDPVRWSDWIAFALILLAVVVMMAPRWSGAAVAP